MLALYRRNASVPGDDTDAVLQVQLGKRSIVCYQLQLKQQHVNIIMEKGRALARPQVLSRLYWKDAGDARGGGGGGGGEGGEEGRSGTQESRFSLRRLGTSQGRAIITGVSLTTTTRIFLSSTGTTKFK